MELALGALLILTPMAMLVLSFGPWLDSRSFVNMAAKEVARAYVLSDGVGGGDLLAAMAETHGVGSVRLGLCGADPVPVSGLNPNGADACPPLEEVADVGVDGGGVTVVVEADVPLFPLPFRDDSGNRVTVGGLTVSGSHTEYVDLYRSFP